MNLVEQEAPRPALTTPDGRRYPFTGKGARAPRMRWTGHAPDDLYVAELSQAFKALVSAAKGSKAQHSANIALGQKLYSDVTGFAFTRYNLEMYYDLPGITTLRRKRISRILNWMPKWPMANPPSGWDQTGFPKDLY